MCRHLFPLFFYIYICLYISMYDSEGMSSFKKEMMSEGDAVKGKMHGLADLVW